MSIFDIVTSGFLWIFIGITTFFLWSQTKLFHDEDSLIINNNEIDKKLAIVSLFALFYSLQKIDTISHSRMKFIINLTFVYVAVLLTQGMIVCGKKDYDCWYPFNIFSEY